MKYRKLVIGALGALTVSALGPVALAQSDTRPSDRTTTPGTSNKNSLKSK